MQKISMQAGIYLYPCFWYTEEPKVIEKREIKKNASYGPKIPMIPHV